MKVAPHGSRTTPNYKTLGFQSVLKASCSSDIIQCIETQRSLAEGADLSCCVPVILYGDGAEAQRNLSTTIVLLILCVFVKIRIQYTCGINDAYFQKIYIYIHTICVHRRPHLKTGFCVPVATGWIGCCSEDHALEIVNAQP